MILGGGGNYRSYCLLILPNPLDLLPKDGNGLLYRVPDDVQVDIEIAVRHAVAHSAHALPLHIRIAGYEFGIFIGQLGGGFADDHDV